MSLFQKTLQKFKMFISKSNLEPPILCKAGGNLEEKKFRKISDFEILRRKMPDGIGIKRNLKKDEKTSFLGFSRLGEVDLEDF